MGNSKVFSEDLKRWYWGDIKAILKELSDGNRHYTHCFRFIGRYSLKDGAHLRKCLRTLEADGLVENHNLGFNSHQWSITEKGKLVILKVE